MYFLNRFVLPVILLCGFSSVAQEDSIRKQELQKIKSEIDSLEMVMRDFIQAIDSLNASFRSVDTLRFYMENPNLHYAFGDQEVILFRQDGFEMKDAEAIEKYLDFRGKMSARGFYLIQYSLDGVPLYGGLWDKSGYLSDVIEFNATGQPVCRWVKSYRTFRREEIE